MQRYAAQATLTKRQYDMKTNKLTELFYNKNATNLLYIPALILFVMFMFYPLAYGIKISFTDWDGYSKAFKYIGMNNYIMLAQDKYFLNSIKNTFIYGFGCTFFQQVIGLAIALILNQKIIGRNISRVAIYLPVLVSPVIMGVIYYLFLHYNYGALNDIVVMLGHERIAWLSRENWAVLAIVIVNTLQFCGISMIIYLAGLQGIPDSYYEAAKIDGAGNFQSFLYITLPFLYPAFLTSITINLIGGLKLFDIIKVLTNGGPGYSSNSISTLIDITYFNAQSAGYASSMGVFLFVMILFITLLLHSIMKKGEIDA